jgi:uncharacterized Zn-finger protein
LSDKKIFKVAQKDLPAFCPPKDPSFWSMHPRVYLEFNEANKAQCPYCGATFNLVA